MDSTGVCRVEYVLVNGGVDEEEEVAGELINSSMAVSSFRRN